MTFAPWNELMKLSRHLLLLVLSSTVVAPAFASVTVSSPSDNAEIQSPFSLQAVAGACSSQPIAATGYSLDNSSQTTIINSAQVNTMVSAPLGSHVLHVKSWGNRGASCVTDVQITVKPVPAIPPTITVTSNIQALPNWNFTNDNSMNGSAQGKVALVSSPSLSGTARQFQVNFANNGGELFHTSFGADTAATSFIYQARVMIAGGSQIYNLEMDMNQVIANGQTVIYGVQCDGYYGTWDYTVNKGTPAKPVDTWVHSNVPCNPANWTRNAWHDVQIAYSRDANGNVTYQSVNFDGTQSEFTNATANSAFALGWAPTLLTNFQIDGMGSTGSATVYLDGVTVYRW